MIEGCPITAMIEGCPITDIISGVFSFTPGKIPLITTIYSYNK
jgi:hypothetical protein